MRPLKWNPEEEFILWRLSVVEAVRKLNHAHAKTLVAQAEVYGWKCVWKSELAMGRTEMFS